ncbi:FAD-dependent oxidoreductase [Nonomuraea aurantiaca]|uniref:FAD-dependent oxidoreductase n=1 Tax=Nonomuraea aurantiaca TaxID=2878562 RepID=UPI001CD93605|nr:FAD-dependent oxidoreductase [Nonomuraea aurantiaca]MCA2219927.1 FAD-dependent oxidoreductase [Nonomuraea aurantiaca]
MRASENRIATSVLVIGTGGAGLRAALELAERGVDVLAVGKRPKADAHTSLAAGGIDAALATMDPEDTWQQHAADTLKESYLLANPETEHAGVVRDEGGPALQVNLVRSGPGSVERESIPPIPAEIAALMREVSTVGKLVE